MLLPNAPLQSAIMEFKSLKRYAWLSVATALSTIVLKGLAWRLTGSVGLLSDAIESFVNLAGALMALGMLSLAARPADDSYAHGHGKAEYFSSAFEGFLIFGAAAWIARWQSPPGFSLQELHISSKWELPRHPKS